MASATGYSTEMEQKNEKLTPLFKVKEIIVVAIVLIIYCKCTRLFGGVNKNARKRSPGKEPQLVKLL